VEQVLSKEKPEKEFSQIDESESSGPPREGLFLPLSLLNRTATRRREERALFDRVARREQVYLRPKVDTHIPYAPKKRKRTFPEPGAHARADQTRLGARCGQRRLSLLPDGTVEDSGDLTARSRDPAVRRMQARPPSTRPELRGCRRWCRTVPAVERCQRWRPGLFMQLEEGLRTGNAPPAVAGARAGWRRSRARGGPTTAHTQRVCTTHSFHEPLRFSKAGSSRDEPAARRERHAQARLPSPPLPYRSPYRSPYCMPVQPGRETFVGPLSPALIL
jgi:hypothetical protein